MIICKRTFKMKKFNNLIIKNKNSKMEKNNLNIVDSFKKVIKRFMILENIFSNLINFNKISIAHKNNMYILVYFEISLFYYNLLIKNSFFYNLRKF